MDLNSLERIKQGNYTEEDIAKLRNARTLMSIIRSAVAVGMIAYIIFATPIFSKMAESGDSVLLTFSKGMKLLLILIFVISVITLVRDILTMVFIHNGMADSGFGQRYITIVEAVGACTGNVVQIIMGALFVIFAVFAMTDGPAHLAEGSTVEGLYIVSVIFIIAGGGVAIAGVISIVKTVIKAVRGG